MTVVWAGGTLEAGTRVECSPPPAEGNDYAARAIVNKPTRATNGDGHNRRGFVVKVADLDKGPFTVDADDVAAQVYVNGESTGAVRLVATKVAKPGKRVKFRYAWRQPGVAAGDEVEYSGCVNAAGDSNDDNDCAGYTTTAVAEP